MQLVRKWVHRSKWCYDNKRLVSQDKDLQWSLEPWSRVYLKQHRTPLNQSYEGFFTPFSHSQCKTLSPLECILSCIHTRFSEATQVKVTRSDDFPQCPRKCGLFGWAFFWMTGFAGADSKPPAGFQLTLSHSTVHGEPNSEEWIRYAVTQRGSRGRGRTESTEREP